MVKFTFCVGVDFLNASTHGGSELSVGVGVWMMMNHGCAPYKMKARLNCKLDWVRGMILDSEGVLSLKV
jgi:hypothetical protein